MLALILVGATLPALAQMSGMNMSMPMKPSHFAVAHQEYTTNHQFLVKLMAVPNPIPYEKYFTIRLAVYDGSNPSMRIPGAQVSVFAGMRHGMKNGFAHGMQSAPKVSVHDGVITVAGMYFHMMGPWTLRTTVRSDGKSGVAYFQLPCCSQ
ncbi:MAG TPA: hypothetical protein VMD07_01930 [Candidatus Acidoferrales bacterium]|nr:hypothetical protein [Candidatus Acidoferrales bacterium]